MKLIYKQFFVIIVILLICFNISLSFNKKNVIENLSLANIEALAQNESVKTVLNVTTTEIIAEDPRTGDKVIMIMIVCEGEGTQECPR